MSPRSDPHLSIHHLDIASGPENVHHPSVQVLHALIQEDQVSASRVQLLRPVPLAAVEVSQTKSLEFVMLKARPDERLPILVPSLSSIKVRAIEFGIANRMCSHPNKQGFLPEFLSSCG
jgi:hypothetical protein